VTPLLYVEDGSSFLLIGSNGGAPAKEPVWLGNVEAMSEVPIEVGTHTLKAKPTVLREGSERDRRLRDMCELLARLAQVRNQRRIPEVPRGQAGPSEMSVFSTAPPRR
jgi:deazaflavin-dependent oxidoreductase (nitroreductase family)